MSAYSHNHTSSCVRRFCRSVPDRSVVSFFFKIHLLYSAFAVTIYLSLPEVFFFFIYIYQFSFSRHWVVALLHQQNYHLIPTVHCFPLILFHSAFLNFFAYQCVTYSLLFGETDQGQTRPERVTQCLPQKRLTIIQSRIYTRRIDKSCPGSTVLYACTGPAVRAAARRRLKVSLIGFDQSGSAWLMPF